MTFTSPTLITNPSLENHLRGYDEFPDGTRKTIYKDEDLHIWNAVFFNMNMVFLIIFFLFL